MKLVYVGPHAQVDVPELGIVATPDSGPVDVTGDPAQSLLSTGLWAKQGDTTAPATSESTPSAPADQTSAPADAVAPKE